MTTATTRKGLASLPDVQLSEHNAALLEVIGRQALGPPLWRTRKRHEAREVLALSQIAARLRVRAFELTTDLRMVLDLDVPVPCLPDPEGELVVAHHAVLQLQYPQVALSTALPGWAFVQVAEPSHVHHPNVASTTETGLGPVAPAQAMCLGTSVPPGTRVLELILGTYVGLTGQTMQLDARSADGVMNAVAARYWIENRHRLPLSREPFLGPVASHEPEDEGGAER